MTSSALALRYRLLTTVAAAIVFTGILPANAAETEQLLGGAPFRFKNSP